MFHKTLQTFWSNLQSREKKLIFAVIALLILGIFCFYLSMSFKKVSVQQNILLKEKENFQYVFEKANSHYEFLQLQTTISNFSSKSDYIMFLSEKFNLADLNLSTDASNETLNFSTTSIENALKFINDASKHPEFLISTIEITPTTNEFEFIVNL